MLTRLALVQKIAEQATTANYQLATAESCTGGGVAKALTEIAGSSAWFTSGLVTYSNQAKKNLLKVDEASLEKHGAVSEAVVKAMVKGACKLAKADLAVAISGVAGPAGGSAEKPVGTVWLAWGNTDKQLAEVFHFTGDRRQVREASIDKALEGLLAWLEKSV
ncbi:CinA family protein [Marinospirillum insulare]|uniref:Damage-inducible protein CinA n=1 Tax=Marinospirillum insulare TaxID=217169 RepID=A0ABQ5ZUM4_9GAMM|nr:CinA family protein [Marinospirillum insulare]GLR62745.1 damage-inducible protein CinA [Marinospirillum insulare]